jgi:hypothetical protein
MVMMPHRRKSIYQPPSQFNAYLAGWAFCGIGVVFCDTSAYREERLIKNPARRRP